MKRILAIGLMVLTASAFGAEKRMAVFVQNRTSTPAMDKAVGSVRERFIAGLAEVQGLSIVDSTMATDAFNASPNVAKLLGVDYVAVIGIIGANSIQRTVNGRSSTVFTLRMTTKITDATGTTVSGMPTWTRQLPVLDASGDAMGFYDMLFDQWAQEAVAAIAQQAGNWRVPSPEASVLVAYKISTTVDRPIAALESQTKGVNGERLAELRKVVGGATIEIDGVVVGTAPCEIKTNLGLHKLRVIREWMKPYEATISVVDGGSLEVAMEMSDAGVAKWGTIEKIQADAADRYGTAAAERGIKINIDTSKWRDGVIGSGGRSVKVVQ